MPEYRRISIITRDRSGQMINEREIAEVTSVDAALDLMEHIEKMAGTSPRARVIIEKGRGDGLPIS